MAHPVTDLDLLPEHLEVIQQRWEDALATAGFDAAVIDAGAAAFYFEDDQAAPYRPNPHFAQWLPSRECEQAKLLVRPGQVAELYFLKPADYWHLPPDPPDWIDGLMELKVFADEESLNHALAGAVQRINRTAFVGEAEAPDLPTLERNPTLLLSPLVFRRAYKTSFEQACMRAATARGVDGHLAAAEAFDAGESEFGVHMAFLKASGQTAEQLPYPNIVAQNEHAGVLHYQHYERASSPQRHSLLIDAGASHQGYAADITRTYAADPDGRFAELVRHLDGEQQSLIAEIRCGQDYLALHESMHRRLAVLLVDVGLAVGSPEAIFEQGVTTTFLPHGLGHLLGLQTHDVGGLQSRPEGGLRNPPDQYPSLRLTRTIEPDQAFTIEPGVYFIPMLLDELRSNPGGKLVRWPVVDALLPCGGIRIEDNVIAQQDGVVNLTRAAFSQASQSASQTASQKRDGSQPKRPA